MTDEDYPEFINGIHINGYVDIMTQEEIEELEDRGGMWGCNDGTLKFSYEDAIYHDYVDRKKEEGKEIELLYPDEIETLPFINQLIPITWFWFPDSCAMLDEDFHWVGNYERYIDDWMIQFGWGRDEEWEEPIDVIYIVNHIYRMLIEIAYVEGAEYWEYEMLLG